MSNLDSRLAQTGRWQVALRENRTSAVCPTGEPLSQEEAYHLRAAAEAGRRQVSILPLSSHKFGELHGQSPSTSWMEYR